MTASLQALQQQAALIRQREQEEQQQKGQRDDSAKDRPQAQQTPASAPLPLPLAPAPAYHPDSSSFMAGRHPQGPVTSSSTSSQQQQHAQSRGLATSSPLLMSDSSTGSNYRADTPDQNFSLSNRLQQFQFRHGSPEPSGSTPAPAPSSSTSYPQQQPMTQHEQSSQGASAPSPSPALHQLRAQQQQQSIQSPSQMQVPSQSSASSSAGINVASPVVPMDASSPFLLPSTMLPPSVLASMAAGDGAPIGGGPPKSTVSAATERSRKKKSGGGKSTRLESPQDVLERILSMRGYGTNLRIKSEQANYDAMPSPLQLASFGTELVKAIHTSDSDRLSKLLSAGLSPNPCNQFRDSIIDLVCKRANAVIFKCLVDHGCDLRVCDGFGRTPLHHCCWASSFSKEIAEIILREDWKQLLIADKRGQTPLEYVRDDQAADWVEFLEDNVNVFFPQGGSVPPLDNLKEIRIDGHLPDPPNALPVSLASAVSSGQMTPAEVASLSPEMRAKFQ